MSLFTPRASETPYAAASNGWGSAAASGSLEMMKDPGLSGVLTRGRSAREVSRPLAASGTYDEENQSGSDGSDSDPYYFSETTRRRIGKGLRILAWSFLVAVVVGVPLGCVIPWGSAAYQPRLNHELDLYVEKNLTFTSVCKFKQFNDGPKGLWTGNNYNGHGRSPNILGWYHHEGNLLELSTPDGKPAWLIQVDFGHYGLMAFRSKAPNLTMPDWTPWGKDCDMYCASPGPGDENPAVLREWLRERQDKKYNGFLFNCWHFVYRFFKAFEPVNLRCRKMTKLSDAFGGLYELSP